MIVESPASLEHENVVRANTVLAHLPVSQETVPAPRHIAIIMDGNGRWANERGLPRVNGHSSGAHALRAVTETCCEIGVECLTVYAFSTENWKRPAEEVSALFGLLEHFLAAELPTMQANNVQLRAIGRLS